jgi:general L-amino acid transport system substrate-binding protein
VLAAADKPDSAVTALTADTRALSTRFGLQEEWAKNVLATVGNYGEIYDRQLGGLSDMKLPRSLNRLYTKGGLLYSLPFK